MKIKRRRFFLSFDWSDNSRIAKRILQLARKQLAGSEINELERIASGRSPRTFRRKEQMHNGKPIIVRETPFTRIVTEFSYLL